MRIFEQTAKIKAFRAFPAGLLIASAWFQPAVAGSDLWWHVASGRDIAARGGPAESDPFSYTFAGQPWMNHEWLWDWVAWQAWSLSPQAVAWFGLAVLIATWTLLWVAAERSAREAAPTWSGAGAAAAIVLAAAACHWFLDLRPHVWTLLLVALFLVTRRQRWAPASWPFLMVIWANVHGGFVFGFGAIGLHVLFETLRQSLARRRLSPPLGPWLAVVATALAMLANPWGVHIFEYPLAYLDGASVYRGLIEWTPPGLSLDPRDFRGRFALLLLGSGAGALFVWRRDPYLVALALVAGSMAWTSRRFIPLFAICSAPLVATALALACAHLARVGPAALRERGALLGWGATALAVVAGLWLWRDVRLTPDLLGRWTQNDHYPTAALAWLEALDPGPRLLNYYNWGGYVFLHAPRFRVFIDGRANTLYDERIYADYMALLRGEGGAATRLARYPEPDAALFPNRSRRALEVLTSPALGWRLVYRDDLASVLLPPASPARRNVPRADAAVRGQPRTAVVRGLQAWQRGEHEVARQRFEEALAADPLLIAAWGELARLHVERGDPGAAEQTIARALAAVPRRHAQIRRLEARAWESGGELARALRAAERIPPGGPFVAPGSLEAWRDGLRRRLASR